MSRRISFSLKTSTAAFTRSSVDDVSSTASSPFHAILVSVPRKSKRVESSLAAWLSALSTSWWSTLLTMSNDESAIRSVPSSGDSRLCLVYPFVVTCLAAGCPSGQWERTVNPSRKLHRFESCTCHHRSEGVTGHAGGFGRPDRPQSVRSSSSGGIERAGYCVQVIREKMAIAVQC